jgi:putative sigma-54 modulation protein
MSIDITVKGKNIQVTDGLKAYTEKRLQKLERYLPALREATVRECVENNQHRVEVTLEGDGLVLRGEERTDNMYASVDLVLDKLEQRAKKFKERHSHTLHHDQTIRKNVFPENDGPFEGIFANNSQHEQDSRPYISRTKKVTMKPMSAEEASERMVLADHDFFIYQDTDTSQVQVIYRRKDGNFGLIMPKL